ncbi:uncharacterized protein [Palaemon carinicauda]|uniref:uncharacterized protein n=1 Tax=Palaemon carinicauda TaxID=392227 RepID=UPI0035B67B0C
MPHRIQMLQIIAWMLTISRLSDVVASEVAFYYYAQNRESFCPPVQHKITNVASTIGCASICLQRQCQGYATQDGECTIMGDMTEPSVGEKEITYQRVSYLTNMENIALLKPTESVGFWTDPADMVKDMAVDGIESSTNYYHSHPMVSKPWWYVDLGENRVVYEVHVLPYGNNGAHTKYFATIEIRVGQELPSMAGDFSMWPLLAYYPGPAPMANAYLEFSPNDSYPLCGRYVSIQKTGFVNGVFYVFSEVKVFSLEKASDF